MRQLRTLEPGVTEQGESSATSRAPVPLPVLVDLSAPADGAIYILPEQNLSKQLLALRFAGYFFDVVHMLDDIKLAPTDLEYPS
jgi:hypothetical protein